MIRASIQGHVRLLVKSDHCQFEGKLPLRAFPEGQQFSAVRVRAIAPGLRP